MNPPAGPMTLLTTDANTVDLRVGRWRGCEEKTEDQFNCISPVVRIEGGALLYDNV
jgi:hypothetical protein